MQITINNNSGTILLKTHRQKVEKAATALAEKMSSAFKQEVALNKSTTAIYNVIVTGQTIDVNVTAITKQ
jgi:hypothetical protein